MIQTIMKTERGPWALIRKLAIGALIIPIGIVSLAGVGSSAPLTTNDKAQEVEAIKSLEFYARNCGKLPDKVAELIEFMKKGLDLDWLEYRVRQLEYLASNPASKKAACDVAQMNVDLLQRTLR